MYKESSIEPFISSATIILNDLFIVFQDRFNVVVDSSNDGNNNALTMMEVDKKESSNSGNGNSNNSDNSSHSKSEVRLPTKLTFNDFEILIVKKSFSS